MLLLFLTLKILMNFARFVNMKRVPKFSTVCYIGKQPKPPFLLLVIKSFWFKGFELKICPFNQSSQSDSKLNIIGLSNKILAGDGVRVIEL